MLFPTGLRYITSTLTWLLVLAMPILTFADASQLILPPSYFLNPLVLGSPIFSEISFTSPAFTDLSLL